MIEIQIKVSEKLFIKDPETSTLGKKIVRDGLKLIDKMGFEDFTFKKLAQEIGSTEASIYRYFENKHKLLIYLMSWYWKWLQYKFEIQTHQVEDAFERLKTGIEIFTHTDVALPTSPGFDKETLYRVVVNESPKAYLTKGVDEINREGAYLSYKHFCMELAKVFREIKPDYPYPTTLLSTCIESAHDQKYFSEHLPSLTEVAGGSREEIKTFILNLICTVLKA